MLECPLVKHVYVLCRRPLGLQTPLIQAIGCKMKGDSCESNLLTASLAVPTSLEKKASENFLAWHWSYASWVQTHDLQLSLRSPTYKSDDIMTSFVVVWLNSATLRSHGSHAGNGNKRKREGYCRTSNRSDQLQSCPFPFRSISTSQVNSTFLMHFCVSAGFEELQ